MADIKNVLIDPLAHMTATYADQIIRGARESNLRTGQYLFNHLPEPVCLAITGTILDTFHKELTPREVYDWIDNHLIFDGSVIVGLFWGNQMIWERRGDSIG